jgi:serine protease Do
MHPFKVSFCWLLTATFLSGAASVLAQDSPGLTLARQLNEAFIEVANKVSPAVVVIEITEKADQDQDQAQDEDAGSNRLPQEEQPRHHNHHHHYHSRPQMGEGSGVVITADGYILTNDHVVENADKIEVRFKDGRTYPAEITGTDPESDIAVIKIKATGLTPAKLGNSDATRVGEFVLAVGAPFALSDSVTFGHVSAKGRSFEGETRGYSDQDFIQTDASINPGNSGGPLVNLYGEVIAINTMIEGMNTGIGFAVPINLAKRVKDHLIAEGKFTRSWIGIGIAELKDEREYRDLGKDLAPDTESGIVITEIRAKGPAAKSGLRAGDVVVSVGGKPVETARQLKDAISLEKPGHNLAFSVVRGREHLLVTVKTEALPSDLGLAQSAPSLSGAPEAESPSFGMTVQALTSDLAERYGLEPDAGVIVTVVERDSPADAEGIQPGDVIQEINRQRIANLKQFRQAMKAVDAKKGVMLDLMSEGSSRLVILK